MKDIVLKLIGWIAEWFEKNGPDCFAVVGISGGKDSSVVAALMVAALGKERVFGVLMPNGIQPDIDYSQELVKFLDINHATINIKDAVQSIAEGVKQNDSIGIVSAQTMTNLPARIRMSTLYAVSQTIRGRVINTSNLDETALGYGTRWGDTVGDIAPISGFTAEEVIAIGEYIGLPKKFTQKVPSDGLCGKTDEENFGFSYNDIGTYIRTGSYIDKETKELMDSRIQKNVFKRRPIPAFIPEFSVKIEL